MSFAYLPLYTGDYLRDTQHLSISEHGAYLKLLMYCWDQKGPAPLDERRLMGICNARSTDEIEAMRRVLAEFFVRMDDGHYNQRMQREIERCGSISSARSEAGRKGYQARVKQLPSKSQAIAKQVHLSPSPSPSLTPAPKDEKMRAPLTGSTLSSSVEADVALAVADEKKPAYRLPDCPYQALVDAYHELLPTSPRVEVLTDQRKRHMQARWRQVCADERLDRAAGLQWFRDFFEYVAKSAFLTGKVKPAEGRKPFFAGLDWLMGAEKFIHVYEGRYHR